MQQRFQRPEYVIPAGDATWLVHTSRPAAALIAADGGHRGALALGPTTTPTSIFMEDLDTGYIAPATEAHDRVLDT